MGNNQGKEPPSYNDLPTITALKVKKEIYKKEEKERKSMIKRQIKLRKIIDQNVKKMGNKGLITLKVKLENIPEDEIKSLIDKEGSTIVTPFIVTYCNILQNWSSGGIDSPLYCGTYIIPGIKIKLPS